ncbi:hypothetical protein D3C85_1590840 [compost metagenome]
MIKASMSAGKGTTSRAAARLKVKLVGIISWWKVVIAIKIDGSANAKKANKYLSQRSIVANMNFI